MPASTHEGWFHVDAALAIADTPEGAWTVEPGEDVVLVLYSSGRASPAYFDKGVLNDELVLQVPRARCETGAEVALADLPAARYQRGSTMLTYESLTLAGTLRVERFDRKRFAGTVTLAASAPRLDRTAAGSLAADIPFDVSKKAL